MNRLTYQVGDPEIYAPPSTYLLSRATTDFSSFSRFPLASYKKMLCMATKPPHEIEIVARNGKTCKATMDKPIRGVISTENYWDHPPLFYGFGDRYLVIINLNIHASENMKITTKYVDFKENVYYAVAGDRDMVIALCAHSIVTVSEKTGEVIRSISHSYKFSEGQVLDYHSTAKLLAVPSKNALDILGVDSGLESMKSILSKTWEPHDSATSFTKFFQTRRFSEETSENILLLTAAQNNSELRFWTFNPLTKRFALKEEVTLISPNGGQLDFDISITPSEEYITLCSRKEGLAVIMEIDRLQFKPGKITTWKTPDASRGCCAQMGKVLTTNKSIRVELFLTVLTAEGFLQVMVNESKLASTGLAGPIDSPTNWFASGAGLSSLPVGGAHRLTAVSSSLQGESKALSTASENNAANVVMDQIRSINSELQKLDTDLVKIQKFAGQTLRILESKAFEQMASKLGKEFAARNKHRLSFGSAGDSTGAGASAAEVEPGVLTEVQLEAMETIKEYSSSLRRLTHQNCQKILEERLREALIPALEKATESFNNFDATGSSQMHFSQSNLINSVGPVISHACSDIKAELKKTRLEDQGSFGTSARELSHHAEEFLSNQAAAIEKVSAEVKETKSLISKIAAPQPTVIDPSAVLSKCISIGKSGDWPGALRAALHATDISVLVNFLESEECTANFESIAQPNFIEVADFISLLLQLSYGLDAIPGAIPSRLQKIHLFLVEWDDFLQNIKTSKDPRRESIAKLIADELHKVLAELDRVDSYEENFNRSTRTVFRLSKKIIANFLS